MEDLVRRAEKYLVTNYRAEEGELLWEVSKDNEEIKAIGRNITHKNGIWHRTSHVLIFDEDYVLLQLRGMGTQSAGKYGQSTGGHVAFGDDYRQTAIREIDEELFDGNGVPKDISDSLELVCTYQYAVKDEKRYNREWVGLFTARYSGSFTISKEVECVEDILLANVMEAAKDPASNYSESLRRDMKVYEAIRL